MQRAAARARVSDPGFPRASERGNRHVTPPRPRSPHPAHGPDLPGLAGRLPGPAAVPAGGARSLRGEHRDGRARLPRRPVR
ncbi:hypothetical protein RZS08_54790, partial [Arthrospira platensis SPKY1]|nr:hypothetical protein [Arthrospira platensis SPKY1]